MSPAFPCPCCGYLTMPKERGSFTYCEVCAWEDDDVQADDPDFAGGANKESLNQARENFRLMGVSAERKRSMVRPPLPEEFPPSR